MTVLYVPLHLPVRQAEDFLRRELGHREVTSVKLDHDLNSMVIEHDRKPPETGIWL